MKYCSSSYLIANIPACPFQEKGCANFGPSEKQFQEDLAHYLTFADCWEEKKASPVKYAVGMAVASHTRTRNRQFSFRYAGVIALTFAICLSIPVAAAASISSPLCTAQTESRGLLGVAATDAPAVFVATDFTSTVHRYAASGNQDWVLQLENYVTPSSIEIAYSTDGNVLRISGQQRVVSSESNQWLYEVNPISGAVLKNKTIVVPAVGIQDDPTRAVLTAVFYGDTPAGIFPRPTYGYPVYYDVFPANVHFTEKDFNGSLYSIVPTKQPFVFAAFGMFHRDSAIVLQSARYIAP